MRTCFAVSFSSLWLPHALCNEVLSYKTNKYKSNHHPFSISDSIFEGSRELFLILFSVWCWKWTKSFHLTFFSSLNISTSRRVEFWEGQKIHFNRTQKWNEIVKCFVFPTEQNWLHEFEYHYFHLDHVYHSNVYLMVPFGLNTIFVRFSLTEMGKFYTWHML